MLITALSLLEQGQKKSKCQMRDICLKKMSMLHMMEYHMAIKNHIIENYRRILSNMKKISMTQCKKTSSSKTCTG